MANIVGQPGGVVYAPIFERLERELADVDRQHSVVARARGKRCIDPTLTG